MFCPECGEKAQDDDVFCGNCGTRIQEEIQNKVPEPLTEEMPPAPPITEEPEEPSPLQQQYQQIQQIPKKARSKRKKIILAEIFIVIVIAAGWYFAAQQVTKPQRIAENYFKAVMNADWETVYASSGFPDSEFLSKEQFLNTNAGKKPLTLANYKSKTGTGSFGTEDSLTGTVSIEYYLDGEASPKSYDITLIRQKEKALLFFPKWEISPEEWIAEGFKLHVSKGAAATVDGMLLNESYIDREIRLLHNNDVYRIPKLFVGTHHIKVELKNYEDWEEEYTVAGDQAEFYCSGMQFKESVKTELIEKAGDAVKSFYQAGMEEKSFDEIKNRFNPESGVQSDMKKRYRRFASSLAPDSQGLGIISLNLTDFTGDAEAFTLDDGLGVEVMLDCDYYYTYSYEDFWYRKVKQKERNGSCTSYLTFIYQDNQWMIQSADFSSVY